MSGPLWNSRLETNLSRISEWLKDTFSETLIWRHLILTLASASPTVSILVNTSTSFQLSTRGWLTKWSQLPSRPGVIVSTLWTRFSWCTTKLITPSMETDEPDNHFWSDQHLSITMLRSSQFTQNCLFYVLDNKWNVYHLISSFSV